MSDELECCIVDLEHAQKKFKLLLGCAPDAIIIVDNSGNIKLVNAQAEKLFEYNKQDLLEQPFELLIPERLREPKPACGTYFFDSVNMPAARTGPDFYCRKKMDRSSRSK
jgi:PAS domain-containing protein